MLLALLKSTGQNGFSYGSTAEQVTEGLDLEGKTFVVTGCNSGLGLHTLRVLHARGGHVIGTARTLDKAALACTGLSNSTPVACELTEPSSVRACARQISDLGRPIDALICNAGIMNLPKLEQRHGLEMQFLTNHLGHFILVDGLLGALARDGRVVVVSSVYHDSKAPTEGIQFDNLSGEKGYDGWTAYGQSKLANVLFARQLAKRLPNGQTVNALHPGVIDTNLSRHMNPLVKVPLALGSLLFLKSIPQGAATQCFLATHPSVEGVRGKYFADCNEATPSALSEDDQLAEKLWDVSEELAASLN